MKEQILALRAEGKSYRQICDALGCTKSLISYHCGPGQKRKTLVRQQKSRAAVCECGNPKTKVSAKCNQCYVSNKRETANSRTIGEVLVLTRNQHKFTYIRALARAYMESAKIKRECQICGFTHMVESCHIKPISEFALTDLVGEVNALENLVYLCPNHHVMYDMGLITLQ
jgi:hypothetical protein